MKQRRSLNIDQTLFEIGRVPPQCIDCEEALLGNLLSYSENEVIKQLYYRIMPEYFYKDSHQKIFLAMQHLVEKGDPLDDISVYEQLRFEGNLDLVGGMYYISQLSTKAINLTNASFYFKVMFQKYLQREIIRICSENTREAYEDTTDCFDQLDKLLTQLTELNKSIPDSQVKNAQTIADKFEEKYLKEEHESSAIFLNYLLGWKRFDEYVTINRDKIILIAGATGHGKSALIRLLMFILLERYSDISVLWVTLEDSSEDILRSYLSYKLLIKAKSIKNRKFKKELIPFMTENVRKFHSFDIKFIDESIRSRDILRQFRSFCEARPDKFLILIVDNVLSLADRDDFKDINMMYDSVMQKMLECRQSTKALIFVIHHFNDAQDDKDNIKFGFRPVMRNIKGTEAFRRVPNQVLMINKPAEYKQLINEYSGDQRKVLDKIFIIDTGKNREDKHDDTMGLIHLFAEWDFNYAEEIQLPDIEIKESTNISSQEMKIMIGDHSKNEKYPF